MASVLCRHPLAQAAKSIVVRVATGKRSRRYVLAVVPGDRRVDLSAALSVPDYLKLAKPAVAAIAF